MTIIYNIDCIYIYILLYSWYCHTPSDQRISSEFGGPLESSSNTNGGNAPNFYCTRTQRKNNITIWTRESNELGMFIYIIVYVQSDSPGMLAPVFHSIMYHTTLKTWFLESLFYFQMLWFFIPFNECPWYACKSKFKLVIIVLDIITWFYIKYELSVILISTIVV